MEVADDAIAHLVGVLGMGMGSTSALLGISDLLTLLLDGGISGSSPSVCEAAMEAESILLDIRIAVKVFGIFGFHFRRKAELAAI